LAEEIKVTPQAIIKHINYLKKEGIIKEVEVKDTLVRKAYKLTRPIWFNFERRENLTLVQLAYANWEVKKSKDMDYSKLSELEDYCKDIRVKLSFLKKKQIRLIEELFNILKEKEELMVSCDPIEEAVIKASLNPDYKDEVIKIAKVFKVKLEKIEEEIINKFNLPRP